MNLFEPFAYPFMQEAFLAATVVGVLCSVLSCFLVLKGWSLMGDAISHAVLPGIVIAYVVGLPLALGAFASGLFCALGAGYLKANSRIKEDTVLGIVFTGLFALGLVLFTKVETDVHLNHVLFGSLLSIPRADLWQSIILGVIVLSVVAIKWKDLLLFCFDVVQAKAVGLQTGWLNTLFLSLLALSIVVSLQAVGIILVIALLITPGCIGFLWSKRFAIMVLIAAGTTIFAAWFGTYVSFFLDGSTSACIVLTEALILLISLALGPQRRTRRPKSLTARLRPA